MANFHLSSDIHRQYGPLIRTTIGRSGPYRRFALSRILGDPLPEFRALLLVDTGAALTFLDQGIILRLELRKRSVTRVFAPGINEAKLVDTFEASLELHGSNGDSHEIGALEVCPWDFSRRHHQGLLGRDVLQRCTLDYEGRLGKFSLKS